MYGINSQAQRPLLHAGCSVPAHSAKPPRGAARLTAAPAQQGAGLAQVGKRAQHPPTTPPSCTWTLVKSREIGGLQRVYNFKRQRLPPPSHRPYKSEDS